MSKKKYNVVKKKIKFGVIKTPGRRVVVFFVKELLPTNFFSLFFLSVRALEVHF